MLLALKQKRIHCICTVQKCCYTSKTLAVEEGMLELECKESTWEERSEEIMKVATKIYSVSKGQASKRQLDDVMNKELKKTETIVLRVAKN